MQMDWIDSSSISSAIEDLMDRFKDELVINVDITLDSMCETFTIAIRDLSPYAVTKVVVWNYMIGQFAIGSFGSRLWGYLEVIYGGATGPRLCVSQICRLRVPHRL